MPRSCGLMRPTGVTAVASVITSAAPPTARLPRCTRCQSFENPSTLEYSHIGETTMRLSSVSERIRSPVIVTGAVRLGTGALGTWGPGDLGTWGLGEPLAQEVEKQNEGPC